MSPSPPPQPTPSSSTRQKQKPFATGIAAGAEDAKYQAKYKELKRKVKDIESDNDKLHFKVLQAKLSIRRMKMERAVLYERLSTLPGSPSLTDSLPLPSNHVTSGVPPQPSSRSLPGTHQHMRDHSSSLDPDHIHGPPEHNRSQGSQRMVSAPDSRAVPILENSLSSTVAPSPHMSVHSPRRLSAHDISRHQYPPLGPPQPVHSYEPTRGHSNSSPSLHHAHTNSPDTRNRSHSTSRSRSHQVASQPYRGGSGHHISYPESIPAAQQTLHSPPLSERERPRRSDYLDYPTSHGETHPYDRHQPHLQVSPRVHPSEPRSSTRPHNHQRLGPGAYPSRDDHYDRHRDYERERDWERERDRTRDYSRSSREMISPTMAHPAPRSRPPMDRDYDRHVSSTRQREEQPYYQDIHAPSSYPPRLSRSDTPGSGSASGSGAGAAEVPSRPDSRGPYYEHDHVKSSYRLRPVSQQNDEAEFAHEEGRSQTHADRAAVGTSSSGGNLPISEQNHPSLESRKRGRNEMDVDSDNDVGEGTPGSGAVYSHRIQDDRSSKRYREHSRRSTDNQEESRMGPLS